MVEIYDKVKIKSSNVTGIIVDISMIGGHTNYVVESDKANAVGGYGGLWKLIDCEEDDLEKIN